MSALHLAARSDPAPQVATLQLTLGQCSSAGRKVLNQDRCAARIPDGPQLAVKGAVLALADGISSSVVSHEAAQAAVNGFGGGARDQRAQLLAVCAKQAQPVSLRP